MESEEGENPRIHRLFSSDAFGWPGALTRLRERPSRLSGVVRFVLQARAKLRALQPDCVQAHWLVPSLWPIAIDLGRPIDAVAHGSDIELLLRAPRPVRVALVRAALRRDVTFRFVSQDLRARFAKRTTDAILDQSRVEPCRLNIAEPLSRVDARERLGIGTAERVAVVVGRLVTSKRPAVALRAATLAENDRVVVLGDGPELGVLRQRFPAVRFLGRSPRHEALEWIAAADVLVNSSKSEGAPTTIREALALGTRVVSTPCSDLRTRDELYVSGDDAGVGPG